MGAVLFVSRCTPLQREEGGARQISLEIPSHPTEHDLIKRACWKED